MGKYLSEPGERATMFAPIGAIDRLSIYVGVCRSTAREYPEKLRQTWTRYITRQSVSASLEPKIAQYDPGLLFLASIDPHTIVWLNPFAASAWAASGAEIAQRSADTESESLDGRRGGRRPEPPGSRPRRFESSVGTGGKPCRPGLAKSCGRDRNGRSGDRKDWQYYSGTGSVRSGSTPVPANRPPARSPPRGGQ